MNFQSLRLYLNRKGIKDAKNHNFKFAEIVARTFME